MPAHASQHTTDKIEIQRNWLLQLHKEHERICWQFKVSLAAPIIEINNSSASWGSWHPTSRTLKISKNLITLHTWDVVIHVLKHEMAHQVVSELFQGREKHGPLFNKACELLGVPLQFRGASGDLPKILPDIHERALKSPHQKMLVKIEKLLALADSANEHESLLAMEKANNLIGRYNIERVELAQKAQYDSVIISHRKKRIENYQRRICSILSKHFFVKVIMSDLYDAGTCCTHKTIEIFGTSENVVIAHYVYHFLLSQLDFLWHRFKRHNKTTGRQKRSYWLGVLDGFDGKLSKQKENVLASNKNLNALICLDDRALTHFIGLTYPRLTSRKTNPARVHLTEFQAGQIDGKKLKLKKGLNSHDGNQGKMLTDQ